jgi:hypothetical protein
MVLVMVEEGLLRVFLMLVFAKAWSKEGPMSLDEIRWILYALSPWGSGMRWGKQ